MVDSRSDMWADTRSDRGIERVPGTGGVPGPGPGSGQTGRRETDLSAFTSVPLEESREWTEDGVPVLRASVSLLTPPCQEQDPGGRRNPRWRQEPCWQRITGFYRLQCRSFLRYCQGELLPWARAEGRRAMGRSVPVPCFRAELTCQETYRRGRLWSLYTQAWDNAGPGASALRRWGDIWDLSTSRPVPAADFFPLRDRWRRRVLTAAEAAFRKWEEQGRFYPHLRRNLRRYWNPRNCYVTDTGLVFFWPQYALGPAAEGIPRLTLPYGDILPYGEGEPPLAPLR